MKRLFTVSILLLFIGCASNTVNTEPPEPIEPSEGAISVNQVVEASCGQCQFGMTEKSGCDLA
ncbi:uncharacterized protein METZ01_LOCUS475399, partial [marine metagenome]